MNPDIAYISHNTPEGPVIFQVLNEDGTDWDQEATAAEYQAYLEKQKTSENNKD